MMLNKLIPEVRDRKVKQYTMSWLHRLQSYYYPKVVEKLHKAKGSCSFGVLTLVLRVPLLVREQEEDEAKG